MTERPPVRTDPVTALLLAVRLRGRGTASEVATTTAHLVGESAVDLGGALDALVADEWVRRRGEPARLSLRPAGDVALTARLAAETETAGRAELTEAYEAFLPLNRRFLSLVRAHESGVDADGPLAELVGELQPVLDGLRERLARFEGYRGRFARAVGRARDDPGWIASPRRDSIHTVWFELHEHLLATLGRDRTQER